MEKNFVLENITFFDKREGKVVTTEELSVTENGEYTADAGKAYSKVTVDVSGGIPVLVLTHSGGSGGGAGDDVVTNLDELNALGATNEQILLTANENMTTAFSFDGGDYYDIYPFVVTKSDNVYSGVTCGGMTGSYYLLTISINKTTGVISISYN